MGGDGEGLVVGGDWEWDGQKETHKRSILAG